MLDDLPKLIRQVEALRQQKNKAEGAVGQLLKQLKEEFGLKSLIEAKRKLAELGEEERLQFAAYNEARKEFDRKYKKQLEGLK